MTREEYRKFEEMLTRIMKEMSEKMQKVFSEELRIDREERKKV